MKNSRMKYLFPIGLFIALFLDGSLSLAWAPWMFTDHVSIESRLVLLWLVMAVGYGEDIKHIMLWATLAGIVFDLYYTGILGVMTVILPITVYLTRVMFQYFARSFLVVFLIYLVDILIITFLFYWSNLLSGFTSTDLVEFIVRTMGPTLLYNMVAFVLLFLPLKKFYTEVR